MSLVLYPNEILTQKSNLIVSSIPDDKELQRLIAGMYNIMETLGGVGLSAIQVGVPRSVFVLKIDGIKQTVINPSIKKTTEEFSYENEGCLSAPGVYTRIRRPENVTVEFFDEYGVKQERQYGGLWARAFQHEYDHLQGLTFFDRMNFVQANSALKKYKKFTKIIPKEYFTGALTSEKPQPPVPHASTATDEAESHSKSQG
jgi:peptide deformylase